LLSDLLYYLVDTDGFVLLLVPAAIYSNADIQPFELRARMFGARTEASGKVNILSDNKNKAGVYL
jgi:hypothetical protein